MDLRIGQLIFLITLLLSLAIVSNVEANYLRSLDYSTLDDSFEIHFKFRKSDFNPEVITTASPPRVILDFKSTKNKLDQKSFVVDIDNLKNIQVLESDSKLRVILNLVSLDYFQMSKDKRSLRFVSGSLAKPSAKNYRNKKGKIVKFNLESNALHLLLVEKKLQQLSTSQQVKEDELEILWRSEDKNIVNKIKDGLPISDPLDFKKSADGDKKFPTLSRPFGTIANDDDNWDIYFEGFADKTQLKATTNTLVPANKDDKKNVVTESKTNNKSQKKRIVLKNNEEKLQPIIIHKTKILNFEFEKNSNLDAILRLDFSNSNIDIDIQRHYRQLVLKFFNTQINEDKIAIVDVRNFRTVVDSFDFSNLDKNAKIEINFNSNFEYLIYQSGSKYSIIFSKKIDDNKLSGMLNPKSSKKINLNFEKINVADAIKVIAESVNINLIIPDNLNGRVSFNLTDVPWNEAINLILASVGYDSIQQNGVLLVREQAEIDKIKSRASKNKVLVKEIIEINHSSSQNIADFIVKSKALTGRGRVTLDKRTNSLLIEDTEDNLVSLRSLISQIDVPVKQISIEAQIVVANTSYRNELGVRWGVEDSTGNLRVFADRENAFGVATDDLAVNLRANNAVANIDLGILDFGQVLDIELSAMENQGKGEVVSKPKIITGNNQQAKISSGQEFAYFNRDRDGLVSTTSFKQAVLSLLVKPQVTSNNSIVIDLDISQDSLSGFSNGIPIIDVTKLKTKVKVQNGRTIILGGVFQNNETESVDMVPILGRIPLLGRLFRRNLTTNSKQEILVFITPQILA